eukprot:jgi/Chlat1/6832/Chrsp51S00508
MADDADADAGPDPVGDDTGAMPEVELPPPQQNAQQTLRGGGPRRFKYQDDGSEEPMVRHARQHCLPPPPELQELRAHIVRLGDADPNTGMAPPPLEPTLVQLVSMLPAALEEYQQDVIDVVVRSVLELPTKVHIYGVLVGLLNKDNRPVVAEIVERTHTELQHGLDSAGVNTIKVLLRFLAALVNSSVLAPATLLEVAGKMVGYALETAGRPDRPVWQPRADYYVFAVLAMLPWGALTLAEKATEGFEALLSSTEEYMQKRRSFAPAALHALQQPPEATSQDYLDDIWQRVTETRATSAWSLNCVPTLHAAFGQQLAESEPHEFGAVGFPGFDLPGGNADVARLAIIRAYPPRVLFRLLPTAKTEQNLQPLERSVAELGIVDTLYHFNANRRECSFRLATLIPRNDSLLMMMLPSPPFKPVYYAVVIMDVCKMRPTEFPPLLARAANSLYQELPRLDVDCAWRLAEWLSHHLSNFNYVWPWQEWGDVLQLSPWHPQRVFVASVIERLIRLSYHGRIRQSLPEGFVELMPPEPKAHFKYSEEVVADVKEEEMAATSNESALSNELYGLVRAKKGAREALQWAEEKLVGLGLRASQEVVAQTLLNIGSKSFTHTVTVLERFQPLLQKLLPDVNAQLSLLDIVASFWCDSSQWTAIVIDQLMAKRLVANTTIVHWAFSPAQASVFHVSDRVWEVLRNAVNKTHARTADLRADVAAAGRAAEAAKGQGGNVKEEVDAAEEQMEVKQALLGRAIKEQEDLFVVLFERFVESISERLSQSNGAADNNGAGTATMEVEDQRADHSEAWVAKTLGYLRMFCRNFHAELVPLAPKLQLIFSDTVHERIRAASSASDCHMCP